MGLCASPACECAKQTAHHFRTTCPINRAPSNLSSENLDDAAIHWLEGANRGCAGALFISARVGLNTGPGWQNALSLSENPLSFVFKSLAVGRGPLRSITAAQTRVP